MRINKYLAKSGLGSRRKCDNFIINGDMKVNGEILKDFSYNVDTNDIVQYKNKYIEVEHTNYYYILNKPRGYICSNIDPQKRKTIFDLVPSGVRLFSIGRLDYDTTGIIILTNNGELSNFLTHPKNKLIKKYYVETDAKLTIQEIKKIYKGIILDNKSKATATIKYLKSNKSKFYWDVLLTEGKNREIKRIFKNFDINVQSIHRYEFCGFQLGSLKEGRYRSIPKKEIELKINTYDYKK